MMRSEGACGWPGSTRVYDLLRDANAASLRRNWRVDGEGLERLESFSHGILAFNHGHLVDGTVVMPLVRERVLFLADARAVDSPLLGHLLRAMGAIRTDVVRPDRAALRTAAQAASAGHLLGIFPEGRVSGDSGLVAAQPGVGYLAAKSRLPVLPVAMWGLSAFNRPLEVYVQRVRPVIHIRVGQPHTVRVDPRDRDALRSAADALMLLVADMLPAHLRGVYASGTQRHDRGREALDTGLVERET